MNAVTRLLLRYRSAPQIPPALALTVALTAMLLLAASSTARAHWTKLSSGASFSDVLTDYAVSPDGKWVVYWHDPDGEDVYELYSAPTSGAGPDRRISGLLPQGAINPREMAITPDSSTVVYVAEQETTDVRELFAVPIAGGPITKLNHNLAVDHEVKNFKISPLGDRVVYALWTTSSSYDDLYRCRSLVESLRSSMARWERSSATTSAR